MIDDGVVVSIPMPRALRDALSSAARAECCSMSYLVRQGAQKILRERGLMPRRELSSAATGSDAALAGLRDKAGA